MKEDTLTSHQERVLRVLVHIQTHLDEALDIFAAALDGVASS